MVVILTTASLTKSAYTTARCRRRRFRRSTIRDDQPPHMIRNTKNTLRAIFLGTAIIALWAVFGLNDARAGTIIQRPLYFGLNQGLVGFWSFDAPDMAGNSAYDRSGSNNTGTLTNGPTRQIGKIGQALSFDGVNDVVSVLDSVSLDSTRNAFTVSAWIYDNDVDDGVDDDRHILDKGDEGTNVNNTFRLGLSDSKQINIAIFDGSSSNTAYGPTPVSFQTWSHVTAVFNGNNITVYLNGVAGTPVVKTIGTLFDAGNLAIGRQSAADCASPYSSCWKGQIDDVRIYNRALSADEIKRLYNIGATTKFNVSQKNTLNNGLVGLWTFDAPDMAGVTAYDRSGSNNTGTLTNGPTRQIGKIGQGLEFDGSNDNVATPLEVGTLDSKTFAGWFYFQEDHDNPGYGWYSWRLMVLEGSSFDSNKYSGLITAGFTIGMWQAYAGGTATFVASANVLESYKWTHVAGTVDKQSGYIRIYINGVLKSSSYSASMPSSTFFDPPGSINIGGGSGGFKFNGLIDDVRIYNRALSPDEIKRLYNIGATTKFNVSKRQDPSLNQGLVGLWTFDAPDMAGVTAYDRSGNNNNGTLTNGVKNAIGKIGQATSFDGVNDYVSIPASQNFAMANMTISMWIKANDFTQWRGLLYIYESAYTDYLILRNNGSGLEFIIEDNDIAKVSANTPSLSTGSWIHIVFVQDGTNWKFYLNGSSSTLSGTNSGYSTNHLTVNVVRIGYSSWASEYFSGLIDDVRVYNRALSPDEIKRLYNMGR